MLRAIKTETIDRYLLLVVALLMHTMLMALLAESTFFTADRQDGKVMNQRCETTFSFFADRGRFELLIKDRKGNYERIEAPKALCLKLLGNETIDLWIGPISGTVHSAEILRKGIDKWTLFGFYEFGMILLLFVAYVPGVLRSAAGKTLVLLLCYVAYRWLVAAL